MGRLRRSRTHGSAKSQIKQKKTKRYGRDLDQIELDLKLSEQIRSIKQTQPKTPTTSSTHNPMNEETIGLGEYPCQECARFFINLHSLQHHLKSKVHKRRLKDLADGPYSLDEAMRVAGLGVDNKQRPATLTPTITATTATTTTTTSNMTIDQTS
ncbi:uncharacterized protein MELLADRAFT_33965 [Melampsora larici-populina 98AG31]|uniref:C2H2-type domain-containing protein n=1 Tax=Melampsora larici-populina (strain 98AG31 / pathotype 3-4-7) TaxID=747676 RepID=F4RBU4_MELLP|nr:uncharacterized protein MELLADRAFT_33965 [Melampsora larici-populina 98AG31]EGG10280.1 hypothetical protein MELLADRAFT_33965 [Melampsora larici-populina 98AG31]